MDEEVATPSIMEPETLDAALRALAHAPPVDPGVGPLVPGTLIGESFRIEEAIGAGGMGVVYRAWDVRLQRRVAIKLHAPGSGSGLGRLLREARALARLSHPNVITVHEVGTLGDRVFIAMEYIDGVDARAWLAERPRALQEILDVFIDAARGLAAAHAAGLIHRDFKPSNVLVGQDGRILVADFGLARLVEDTTAVAAETLETLPLAGDAITVAGSVLGTPAYMAPEQKHGGNVDARADQYAYCVALHEAVHGRLPGDTKSRDGVHPADSEGPKWLRSILQRGLQTDPDQRFASMDELLARLQADPTRGRRRLVFGLGLGLAAIGTAWATYATASSRACRDVGQTIERTWNATVASELRDDMHRTGSPLAETASMRVASELEAYARRWSQQRREACEASRIRGDQSERMLDRRYACLERRRRELEVVIGVLRSADATSIEHAVSTLGALGSLDACADERMLGEEVAPPEDLAVRQAVEELRAEVVRITAEHRAGRSREVKASAESTLARARALAHRPSVVDARLALAEIHRALGEHETAIEQLIVAHAEAVAVGLPQPAWRAAVQAASSIGRVSSGTTEALRWLDVADGWAERLSLSAVDRTSSRRARASALHHAGHYEQAVAELEAALVELSSETDHDLERAGVLDELGMALRELGRLDEAYAVTVQGLERLKAVLGDAHPEVAHALGNSAEIELLRGRTESAVVAAEHGLAIMLERRGAVSLSTASLRVTHATALLHAGSPREAIAEYERAIADFETLDPPPFDAIVVANMDLAVAMMQGGAHEQAIERLQHALELETSTFGPETLRGGEIRINLGAALIYMERWAEAAEESLAAASLLERKFGASQSEIGHARLNAAIALAELGRFDEAHAQIDRTLSSDPKDPATRLGIARTRADLLEMEGRLVEARDQFRAVVEGYVPLLEPDARDLALARLRYGQLLLATGEPAAAVEPLRLALEVIERRELSPSLLGDARMALARALWVHRQRRDEARALAIAAVSVLEAVEPEDAREALRWLEQHR